MADISNELQAALGRSYKLERELGGGGMSRVFLAEETALGRRVVVKVLSPELLIGVNADRFRREIQLAARLQQAQIVPVLSAGEVDGMPYYTMPFVDGESLRAKLTRVGQLPIPEVLSILRDVTRALAYAHQQGIVHRDIKPDNVLLSGGTAVVTDFGIAKAIAEAKGGTNRSDEAALTQLGISVGTPAYVSPEQAAGDPNIDRRSDIYSLGCMAYELLTGKPPFAGSSPQRVLAAHLTEKPQAVDAERSDIPPALAELVMRCLEKEPSARPESATEIATALDAVTTGAFGSASTGLFGRPVTTRMGIGLYAASFVLVAIIAKASVITFGLPDWVFNGAITLMLLGLPAVALAALGTTRHVTWSRTARWGSIAIGTFTTAIVAIMVLRVFGIGPAASLLAAGRMHGREPVLVIDFDAGKDSSLSHVVTEAVRTNLGQSNVISVVPPTAVASALQLMQRPTDTPVDAKLARDIALRQGVRAIVAGNVTQIGNSYLVSIRLVSADSGSELAAYRTSVSDASQLLKAIDDLTRKLRGRIGESLKTVHDAPALDQVTTSSLEALQKYAEAVRASDLLGDYPKSEHLLREAIAKDSNFAMAYRKLGVTLNNMLLPRAQVDSALTRAYELRDRLPEKERYLAVATYYMSGPGLDRTKAAEAFERVLAIDPTDPTAAVNLANTLRTRRQLTQAESIYHGVNTTSHMSQISLSNEAGTVFALGRMQAAESLSRELSTKFPNATSALTLPPRLMYARGQIDSTEAYWRAKSTDANPLVRVSALSSLTAVAMLRGHLKQTAQYADQARAANQARGVPAMPMADSLMASAIAIWFLGQNERGVRMLDAALAASPSNRFSADPSLYFSVGTRYAWAGRPDKARALIAQYDAEVRDPQTRWRLQSDRHALLAEILIAEKKPREAIREIWAADSLPDGPSSDCAHCMDGDLARAFDLASMPDSAIWYWERHLSEPQSRSLPDDALTLAGTYKRLGELYEAKGDYARAESNYEAFVRLWKTADPELQPKVAEVNRRLASIRSRRGG